MISSHEINIIFLITLEIASFLVRVFALIRLPKRHNPSTAMAWLIVILMWPWIGLLAYSLVGTNLLPSRRMDRHSSMRSRFLEMRKNIIASTKRKHEVYPVLPRPLQITADLAQNLSDMHAIEGNSVRFITDADRFLDEIVLHINQAKDEVDLLYYIFNPDKYGLKITEACLQAAARGVKVRMLLDSVGSRSFLHSKHRTALENAGVSVAEALPVRLYRAKAARFDLRNHRKLAIFDHCRAVTGSHNMTSPEYGRKDGLTWKDVSLFLEGPIVYQLESVFFEDWFVETGEQLFTIQAPPAVAFGKESYCLQTVPSGPSYQTQNYQRLIVSSIIKAEQQVTITTPYLIPDEGLRQAIEVAKLKGVTVRLVIPAKSDQIIVGYASRAYYDDFLKQGVEVYLYDKGLLHAKTITVDQDLGFVGSSNFDIRSFELNFELNMLFYGIEENVEIHRIQNSYIKQSRRLTPAAWERRSRISMTLESLTKLLSPLL